MNICNVSDDSIGIKGAVRGDEKSNACAIMQEFLESL